MHYCHMKNAKRVKLGNKNINRLHPERNFFTLIFVYLKQLRLGFNNRIKHKSDVY